jgi:hypothetical protein
MVERALRSPENAGLAGRTDRLFATGRAHGRYTERRDHADDGGRGLAMRHAVALLAATLLAAVSIVGPASAVPLSGEPLENYPPGPEEAEAGEVVIPFSFGGPPRAFSSLEVTVWVAHTMTVVDKFPLITEGCTMPPEPKICSGPGGYAGYSHGVGVSPYTHGPWWTDVPGTYEWQASAIQRGNKAVSQVYSAIIRPSSRPPHPSPASRCGGGDTAATIGSKAKCLHAGQSCTWRYRGQYRRYHFACVKKGHRYRLVRH